MSGLKLASWETTCGLQSYRKSNTKSLVYSHARIEKILKGPWHSWLAVKIRFHQSNRILRSKKAHKKMCTYRALREVDLNTKNYNLMKNTCTKWYWSSQNTNKQTKQTVKQTNYTHNLQNRYIVMTLWGIVRGTNCGKIWQMVKRLRLTVNQ